MRGFVNIDFLKNNTTLIIDIILHICYGMTMENASKTYTVQQIVDMLNINPETVRRWIRDGKLVADQSSKKHGNHITENSLLDFFKDNPKYLVRAANNIALSAYNAISILSKTINRDVFRTNFIDIDSDSSISYEEFLDGLETYVDSIYKLIEEKERIISQASYEITKLKRKISEIELISHNENVFYQVVNQANSLMELRKVGISMSWPYAELSKLAKAAGGPEELLKKTREASRLEGKQEAYRRVFGSLAIVGSIAIASKLLFDFYKRNKSENEVEEIEAELIKSIEDYDSSHTELENEEINSSSNNNEEIKEELEMTKPKYKVLLKFDDGEEVEDDQLFDSPDDAYARGLQMGGEYAVGMETLHLSNPGDYPDEEGNDYEIVVEEV